MPPFRVSVNQGTTTTNTLLKTPTISRSETVLKYLVHHVQDSLINMSIYIKCLPHYLLNTYYNMRNLTISNIRKRLICYLIRIENCLPTLTPVEIYNNILLVNINFCDNIELYHNMDGNRFLKNPKNNRQRYRT